jgi:ribonucrease Y
MLSIQSALLLTILGVGVGFGLGYLIRILVAMSKKNSIELDIKRMMLNAREKSEGIILEAENKAAETLRSARQQAKEREEVLNKNEERVSSREIIVQEKENDLKTEADALKERIAEVKGIKELFQTKLKEADEKLLHIANTSKDEALNLVLSKVENEYQDSIISRIHKIEQNSDEKIEEKAREILTSTVQRLASSVNSEMFTSYVQIESEEVKGKVIGKEGRNIKAFERATGVEVLVDDAHGSITLSAFDPIRRQIAKLALENLILDGRIQPAKIEKEVEDAKKNIEKIIKKEGEKAVYDLGITNLDPKVVNILGRLHFRTSYGQNVLQHSIECANIAGMLASELGANVSVAKTGALVHDIGKALDHEVEGSHVEIGIKILQKFGTDENIIKAMRAHHEEYPYETLESRIVQTADAISGGRTGARKDNIEQYIKRLTELENIALSQVGVDKAYALQAGRELRVFVVPEKVTDVQAQNMAINIAKNIEKNLRYPGEIKVTVIRETRVQEFAK